MKYDEPMSEEHLEELKENFEQCGPLTVGQMRSVFAEIDRLRYELQTALGVMADMKTESDAYLRGLDDGREQERKKKSFMRRCPSCNTPIEDYKHLSRRYCSDRCSRKAAKKRRDERLARSAVQIPIPLEDS